MKRLPTVEQLRRAVREPVTEGTTIYSEGQALTRQFHKAGMIFEEDPQFLAGIRVGLRLAQMLEDEN